MVIIHTAKIAEAFATATYPTLNCTGTWVLDESHPGEVLGSETTAGGTCTGGDFKLDLQENGTLLFTQTAGGSPITAILTRDS